MNLGKNILLKNRILRAMNRNWFFYAMFFCVCLLILHDLPLILDDNGFMQLSFDSNASALHYVLSYGNGRLLGNGGIIFLLHHQPLGDIVRAALIAGIAILLPSILQLKSKFYYFLSLFLLLSISPAAFGQSFAWMSGFQNYVPPVFLFLCGVYLVQIPKNRKHFYWGFVCFLTFVCGVSMQLYIEHSTCINLVLAFLLLLKTQKAKTDTIIRWKALVFFAGSLIGLFIMLKIMRFHGSEPIGHVSYLSRGLFNLFYGIVRNGALIAGMFSENAILLTELAILHILLLFRYKQSYSLRERTVSTVMLSGTAFAFLAQLIIGFRPWYGKLLFGETAWNLLLLVIYITTTVFIDIRIIKLQKNKRIQNSLILSLLSICGLLLLVVIWPIGYRCLFHPYVLLCMSGLLLCDEIFCGDENAFLSNIIKTASISTLCIITLCLVFLFTDIRRMVSIRDQYIEEEVKNGADIVAYFTIPSSYIYDEWNEEYEQFRTVAGKTVQLKILPADVWFRMYYYRYT